MRMMMVPSEMAGVAMITSFIEYLPSSMYSGSAFALTRAILRPARKACLARHSAHHVVAQARLELAETSLAAGQDRRLIRHCV